MPQVILHRTPNKCVLAHRANRSWGYEDTFFTDASTSDQQNSSVWSKQIIGVQNIDDYLSRQYIQSCSQSYFISTPTITAEIIGGSFCGWIEKKNSFTQADLLEAEEDQLQALLLRFKTTLSVSVTFRDQLINRITELLRDIEEDEDKSASISSDSLLTFYSFCYLHSGLKFPDISLTPAGNIYAAWNREQNRVFSILFLSKGTVQFALLEPNKRYPDRQIVLSGELTIDTILDKVKSFNVLSWITEQ